MSTTIARFATCFDLRDWVGLESLLSEEIRVDYADLRGQVETLTREAFVRQRREALASLTTQHLLGNLEVHHAGAFASCRAAAVIYRRKGERAFDSHVVYEFGLVERSGTWLITSIEQRVLWSEGDPSIHPGAVPAGPQASAGSRPSARARSHSSS